MSRWSLAAVRTRLAGRAPAAAPTERPAAVAVVLRFGPAGDDPHVLLMQRAEREGDPWSGHVSFPGGRHEPGDPDLVATAIRETREELQIDLAASGELLGALDPIAATGRSTGRPLPATGVAPYVFAEVDHLAPAPGPEAASVFWLPIERAAAGELDGAMQYVHLGTPMTFPCWNFDGYVIWGLTYRMLRSLVETVTGAG